MRVICFVTPPAGQPAAGLIEAFRARVPAGAAVTVVAGNVDRIAAAAGFPGCEVLPDKPAGAKGAFVRELRRRRYDLALVAWTGGERIRPMRVVALVAGARRVLVLDERGRWFEAGWSRPWSLSGHALRRLGGMKFDDLLWLLAAVYRWTIGLALAWPLLAWRWLRLPAAHPGRRA
jgi:hypothetical protein